MIRALDTVVLIHDIEEYALKEGDIGTVVHCYSSGKAYEVEFVSADGRTIAVITLTHDDIRLMHSKEILHVRKCNSLISEKHYDNVEDMVKCSCGGLQYIWKE